MTESEFLLALLTITASALARGVAQCFIRHLAQAIPAQAVLAGDRHTQAGGFLRAPAGAGQAAAEFSAAGRAGYPAGFLIF